MKCINCGENIFELVCSNCGKSQSSFFNNTKVRLSELVEFIYNTELYKEDFNKIIDNLDLDLDTECEGLFLILDEVLIKDIENLNSIKEYKNFVNLKMKRDYYKLKVDQKIIKSVLVNLIKIIRKDLFIKTHKKTHKQRKWILPTVLISVVFSVSLLLIILNKEIDETPPEIIINGSSEMTLIKGEEYIELGADVIDNSDKNLEPMITGDVDTSTPGVYMIYYNAVDKSNNQATNKIRVVTVIEEKDVVAPIITLNGSNDVVLALNEEYIELGATCYDNVDKSINVIITGDVDYTKEGTYYIYYNAVDSSNNLAKEVIRKVTVIKMEDIISPVVSLNGDSIIEVIVGHEYIELGANVTDNMDDSPILEINGTVDTSVLGEYIIEYTGTDESDNITKEYRNVIVKNVDSWIHSNFIKSSEDIIVYFNGEVDQETIESNIKVVGNIKGRYDYSFTFDNNKLSLKPSSDFFVGETVRVMLSEDLLLTSGKSIPNNFKVKVVPNKISYDINEHSIGLINKNSVTTTADINGDGFVDIASVNLFDGELGWYENNSLKFNYEVIENIEAERVSATDLDLDGDIDLIVGKTFGASLYWFENDNGSFVRHIISSEERNITYVALDDLDNDGDIDVVCSSRDNYTISWYENDGLTFTRHIIDDNVLGFVTIEFDDLDLDGDLDIITSSNADNLITWYENDDGFNKKVIDTNTARPSSVSTTDIDGDGDVDVLVSSQLDNRIIIYENTHQYFEKQVVSSNAALCYWTMPYDLDGDGSIDIISSEEKGIYIYWFNNGEYNKVQFSRETAHSVNVIDIDGDSDLDIISSTNNELVWYDLTKGEG